MLAEFWRAARCLSLPEGRGRSMPALAASLSSNHLLRIQSKLQIETESFPIETWRRVGSVNVSPPQLLPPAPEALESSQNPALEQWFSTCVGHDAQRPWEDTDIYVMVHNSSRMTVMK